MAEYTGSRRASAPPGPQPLTAAEARSAFAEDDAVPSCPECGAGIRAEQEWCTLCLHVLRAPEPPPVPVTAQVAAPDQTAGTAQPVAPAQPGPTGPATPAEPPSVSPEVAAQVEAAADALLAQLAVEAHRDRLAVPSFLATKSRVAVAVTVGMTGLAVLGVLGMSILGAVLR